MRTDCTQNGNLEQELSYDAWGNLRNPNTWCVDKTIRPMFDRGYTGQEHLNAFGLINMNGRMYDPVMSSFLSVDRYVQQPDNSQGFNRYAYCMYNPLRYVDPSGWLMSRPYGSGTIPPNGAPNKQPVAIDGGYRLAVIDGTLYGGCLGEAVVTDYAIHSSGSTFEEYPIWSSERSFGNDDLGGENVPTISEAGNSGGGLGVFWTNYSKSPSKKNGVAFNSVSYGISYAGLVTGFKKDLWEKPGSRAQKAINQKKAYNTQKALKAKGITKSVKEIKATKVVNLRTGGYALASVSAAIEVADIYMNKEINASNIVNVVAAGFGAVFWQVSLVYLAVDMGFIVITGESLGNNIDKWVGGSVWSFK